jgi:hypothetical protein
MNGRFRVRLIAAAVCLTAGFGSAPLLAQRGGRGGGGGGMGGGMGMVPATRLSMVTSTLKLDDAQKKQAKKTLDDAFKAAAPIRTALTAARQKLGAAIQAGDDAQIEQAMAAYADQATAMAAAETKAVATIVRELTPGQATAAAVQTTVSLMRGAFVGKKWDTTPDVRFY